jgi:hypothetical protein
MAPQQAAYPPPELAQAGYLAFAHPPGPPCHDPADRHLRRVGLVSYASMDAFLTRQLDEQLSQAADRSNDPGRPPMGGFNGRDPLDARGQSVGTLNARVLNGQVNSAGFLASDTTRSPLSAEDKQVLLELATDGSRWTAPSPTAITG